MLLTLCSSVGVQQVFFYVFTGEENSRVQAHIDRDEFSAHILTDEMEYNVEVTISKLSYPFWDMFPFFFVFPFLYSAFLHLFPYLHPPLTTWHLFSLPVQPLWRFTDSQIDSGLLVYRSEDIRNLSRLASPKVCGYIKEEPRDLLPESARRQWDSQEAGDHENGERSLCSFTTRLEYPKRVRRNAHMQNVEEVEVYICVRSNRSWSICSLVLTLFVDGKEWIV